MIVDFETGGLDPETCPVVQLAALVIDSRSLDIFSDGIFSSMINPDNPEDIKDEALDKNKKTREEISKAPAQKIVWDQFTKFVDKFRKDKTKWGLPILAGHNIENYDKIILNRLCKQYNSKPIIHPIHSLDTLKLCFYWFESSAYVEKYNLDYLRTKLKFSNKSISESHDALSDCYDTYDILKRFINLSRNITPKIKF